MIQFGIDLGTTRSAIARFEQGKVSLYKDPVSHKDTLASVVAFLKDKIVVGDKARELLLNDPLRVIGSFKRKMGTTETYKVPDQDEPISPVELSAYVLKELKQFVNEEESPDAAVITIPASFDTIQSNATKKAGHMAGFEQVNLLQEPIAASLAYANKDDSDQFEEGQWLVYDLGGGTFDVALVRIKDGEMKVIDHEGDNFLGGDDFDRQIVEQLIVSKLEEAGSFKSLLKKMKSAKGKYNALYQKLLYLAEEAKLKLSSAKSAEIEFEATDEKGNEMELQIKISRRAFNELLEPFLARTVHMIQAILTRNSLSSSDLKFVLLVGGSTYIPFFREQLGKRLEMEVNTQVDPTTAVAVGAAFFAGTQARKTASKSQAVAGAETAKGNLTVNMAYQKASQENEEYFTAKFEGETEGFYYRITRKDGGYDSGTKPLSNRISEDLPLVKNAFNQFSLRILDEQADTILFLEDAIEITQGRYSVVGQPLPHDICIEVDDVENSTTVLEVVFEKNSILPLKKTLVKQITRTIAKGSDDRLTITVVEGPGTALPATTQPIGFISVQGKDLHRDLVRGSDIEITLEISESRDLSINAYLMMTDQEYEDVFTPSERRVNVPRLVEELLLLADKIRKEIAEAELESHYEAAQRLVDLEYEILELADEAKQLAEDDITDAKFQIEDRKRKIAQRVDELTRDKFIIKVKKEYFDTKRYMEFVLAAYSPREEEQNQYKDILQTEKATLATNSSLKIRELMDQIRRLNWRIRWQSSRYIREFFADLAYGRYGPFTQPDRARGIIETGKQAITEGNDEKLRVCINQLVELLPPAQKQDVRFGGTGIG